MNKNMDRVDWNIGDFALKIVVEMPKILFLAEWRNFWQDFWQFLGRIFYEGRVVFCMASEKIILWDSFRRSVLDCMGFAKNRL